MKQQISWADEQMLPMDMHPASLCNINPTPAIAAHTLYNFFLCMLSLYKYISKSLLSEYYLITLKKLSFQFPFQFPPSRQTREIIPETWLNSFPMRMANLEICPDVTVEFTWRLLLNRVIIHGFFPMLRHQFFFIILKVSVPLLNLIEMGNGFKNSEWK